MHYHPLRKMLSKSLRLKQERTFEDILACIRSPALEMTACTRAASAMEAVWAPKLIMEKAFSGQLAVDVRPTVGRSPTTPHSADGTRTEPPPSMPAPQHLCTPQKLLRTLESETGEQFLRLLLWPHRVFKHVLGNEEADETCKVHSSVYFGEAIGSTMREIRTAAFQMHTNYILSA